MEPSFAQWAIFFAVYFSIGLLIARGIVTYRQSCGKVNDWDQLSFPMGLFWPIWIPAYFVIQALWVSLQEFEKLSIRVMYYVDAMFRKVFKMPAVEKPWVKEQREQKELQAKMDAAAFRDWAEETESLKHQIAACTNPEEFRKLKAQESAMYAYGIERKWCTPT